MLPKPHLRITTVYLVVASVWILVSDFVLVFFGADVSRLAQISILKGLGFVLVTSTFLYLYLRRAFNLRFQLEQELRQQMQQINGSTLVLEQSEVRFRNAVEESPHPIMIFAENGEIVSMNRVWRETTGYTMEALGTIERWTELAYGEGKQPVREHIDKLFSLTGRIDEGEYTIRCADGSQRVWAFSSTPLGTLPDGRRIVMSIAADITLRKQSEKQLHIKDSAIASSITPIALADLEGRLTYVNHAFLKLWKLNDVMEALGRPIRDFWIPPQAAQNVIDTLFAHDSFVGELTARLADGETTDIALMASMVRDEKGIPICIMGSFQDISQQKQTEAFALENERLKIRFQKERERNTLVQRIVSTLSHDLRTSLTMILSSKDMLTHYFDSLTPEKRQEKLDTIERGVQFALELLEDTVSMARGNLSEVPFRPAPVNIAVLCQVSVDEIQSADENNHRLRFLNPDSVQVAVLDEVLVSRILLNLLSNAIKYSPAGSNVILKLEDRDKWISLHVIDEGIGINEHDLAYIFDPFFRSDDVGKIRGTGLGLSIVKDCVDRHRGRVSVQSTPGKGSIFTVELPFQKVPETVMALP